MSKPIKFYYDLMSQPARALWISLKLDKTPFEDHPVALRKREQHSEEYRKINPFGKVPCIVHGDFNLSESIAIIRYLSTKGQLSESLYPSEAKRRARVDEFLEWQHLGIRYGCGSYFIRLWLLPMNGLAHPPSKEKISELRKEMENTLKVVENIFLKDRKYLTGNDMTIADIMGACEVEQTRLTQYDVKEKFPKIADWISRVRNETNPYYDKAHEYIYKKSSYSKL